MKLFSLTEVIDNQQSKVGVCEQIHASGWNCSRKLMQHKNYCYM